MKRRRDSGRRGPTLRKLYLALGYGLALSSVPALLMLGAYAFLQLAQVSVERVVFTGDVPRAAQSELETLVNENLHGGFLSVDIERIQDSLHNHPWVFKAVVKRRWPGALEIQITEQTPIALWGEHSYLNHQGEVFAPFHYQALPHLPKLQGPEGSQLQLMRHYLFMREHMQQLGLQVVALDMDVLGGLVARLDNGGELVFGRGQLPEKVARFVGVYRADLAGREHLLRSVDMRYRHGLAVAWLSSQS